MSDKQQTPSVSAGHVEEIQAVLGRWLHHYVDEAITCRWSDVALALNALALNASNDAWDAAQRTDGPA